MYELLRVLRALRPQFLKDPGSYAKLGARPPKGILLEGDPGAQCGGSTQPAAAA